jgi:Histidine phosphatase superfamily (branch 1)
VRLFVFARHAESLLNIERRINGDPSVEVPLTPEGESQAHKLGVEVRNLDFDLCVHTRFTRTRLTAEIALAGRDVPLTAEPLLDDIDVGELEGKTLEAYRRHARDPDPLCAERRRGLGLAGWPRARGRECRSVPLRRRGADARGGGNRNGPRRVDSVATNRGAARAAESGLRP